MGYSCRYSILMPEVLMNLSQTSISRATVFWNSSGVWRGAGSAASAASFSFISDEYNKFELEGSLLADTTKPFDAVLGQFGRIVQL